MFKKVFLLILVCVTVLGLASCAVLNKNLNAAKEKYYQLRPQYIALKAAVYGSEAENDSGVVIDTRGKTAIWLDLQKKNPALTEALIKANKELTEFDKAAMAAFNADLSWDSGAATMDNVVKLLIQGLNIYNNSRH